MASIVTVPSFDFTAFYYQQILDALMLYKRENVPELTDESDIEPSVQFMKMMALVGHLNNCLTDMVANESTLPTAKLVETIRNMLRLIDYEMKPATPAQADIIYQLSKVFTSSFEIIPSRSQIATEQTEDTDPIYYEALTGLTIDRTDQHSYVFADENGTFTDYTTEANSTTTPTNDFTPWSTPASKDAIYFGHKHVLWDKLNIILTTPGANISGVWEFYDGDWSKTNPSSVTDLGTTLEFDLTSLLGSSNRQGTKLRIQLNSTSAFEDVYSTWSGSANIATTSNLLGQVSPSTDQTDYTIGSDWTILDVNDGTQNLTQSGEVSYTLPQTVNQDWIQSEVNNETAFWIRYRITVVTTPTAPVFQYTKMDTGKQYVKRLVTQGRTKTDSPFSSNGLDNQQFKLNEENFLWGSETVTVGSDTWTRVDNFLDSLSTDKHYTVVLGENDIATIVFGGNGKGAAPPVGIGNITVLYRHGGDTNGNVGANKITVDKTGLTFIDNAKNPRQAVGWAEADGASETSLARVKIEGPASIRTKDVAIGPDDVVLMAKNYQSSDGSSPFERAFAIEEGYGPKTIELVLMAKGGGFASAEQLSAIAEYFNGNKYSNPQLPQRIVANQQVVAVNYNQKTVDVTAIVYGNIEKTIIEDRLTQILQPNALKSNGSTYEWDFGELIEQSKLNHEIFDIDEDNITKVEISVPSSSGVQLQPRELPIVGALSITVVAP
jgi:hypothetical protein